jgi:hypothetical protein
MKPVIACLVTLAALGAVPARAQPVEAELAPVSVTGTRDPAAFDVARGLALMRTFEAIPAAERDKIRLSFHVRMRSGEPLPPNLRVSLVTDELERPLSLLPSGELVMPALDDASARGSGVVTTARRGTLEINYYVEPRLDRPMTMGALRAALVQARAAWKKLYGPLTGWTVPVFTCAASVHAVPTVVSVRDPRTPGTSAWQSDALVRVTIPLTDPALRDDFVVDWGPGAPRRVAGCVTAAQDTASIR